MYLDYSKLEFDAYGRPEAPELMLKTLGNKPIGILSGVHGLKFHIKFSEPSEMTFSIPEVISGSKNPLYDSVTGRKIIYTKNYGVYVTMNPKTETDGISGIKTITAYSLEKRLEDKKFFLEEGTFNFYHPVESADTILGRILEVAVGWKIGYVSPSLIGRYRTFEQYDDYLLSFIYNTAPSILRCVFVFNSYEKSINVYDADEARPTLPIYLDFDNLVETLSISELSDELATAIRPYGADDLDISGVNPIGSNWIYDLSYFISNGDIPPDLAKKWDAWQKAVLNRQEYYKGLVSMRASGTAQLLTAKADLVELNGELEGLTAKQNVTIQALALETTDEGIQSQQEVLDDINAQIATKKAEISAKEAKISEMETKINGDSEDSYSGRIQAIVAELSLKNYFTEEEYETLQEFFIEQDVIEDTFVASSIDSSVSGNNYNVGSSMLCISDSIVEHIDLREEFSKQMYTMAGGNFSISGSFSLSCDVIRGTLEVVNNDSYVMSIYAGTISVNEVSAPSGVITISGTLDDLVSDVSTSDVYGIQYEKGTSLQLNCPSGNMFLTANVSEYQKYSVQMELYEYAVALLSEIAVPTYEFSVDSGNFLFVEEFEPFRKNFELGSGIYLKIGETQVITPIAIEIEFEFEDESKFSLVFSNRFKRHDNVNTLKNMIEKSYSSSRTFDANKHVYNQSTKQASSVAQFMNSSLDAAKNAIIAAANQSVLINGAGIQVGGDSKYQLRIVDSMIAMTDDGWQTSKMAIGHFASDEIGDYWGINTEVLGGKIAITQNLFVESEGDNGVVQFRVDASGAWLNNSTFVLQKDDGGKIIIDPKYGILAGTGDLFTTSGTTVSPSFTDNDGYIIFDEDGMPKNANFYLDLNDGSAYFRGTVNAESGSIGGWVLSDDYLYSGSGNTYVALNASGSTNSAYAIWAGATSPSNAPFAVKKNGDLYAKNGTFKGTLHGATYKDSSGNSMMNSSEQFMADYLSLYGLEITDGTKTTFQVTAGGQVNINANVTMGAGSSINWAQVSESNVASSSAYALANTANKAAANAQSAADGAQALADNAQELAEYAWNEGSTAYSQLQALANGQYTGGTFINGNGIISPVFYASSNDYMTFSEFDADSLTFYSEGYSKICLDYGSSSTNGHLYAGLRLGNNTPGWIKKYYESGSHLLWVGGEDGPPGILFNLTTGTYKLFGTQA